MLKYLNKFGEELEYRDFIDLQWNRRYDHPGDFVLFLPSSTYTDDIKYLKLDGRPETGIVQKVVYEKKSDGDFVTLSGFFIDKLLDNGMLLMDIWQNNPSSESTTRAFIRLIFWLCFSQQTRDLDREFNNGVVGIAPTLARTDCFYQTSVDSGSQFPSLTSQRMSSGIPVGTQLYNLLYSNGHSYYCIPTWNRDESKPLLSITLKGYKGRDISNRVYFGAPWGSVEKIDYMIDESNISTRYVAVQILDTDVNYSNMIYVHKDGKYKKAIYEYYEYGNNAPSDLGLCKPIKVIYTQVNGIEAGNEKGVRAQMQQEMKLDMLNNYKVEHISCDVLQNRFHYLKDYDLGDICTVSIDEIKQQYKARIIEIREVHHSNTLDIEVILGTPYRIKYRKVLV